MDCVWPLVENMPPTREPRTLLSSMATGQSAFNAELLQNRARRVGWIGPTPLTNTERVHAVPNAAPAVPTLTNADAVKSTQFPATEHVVGLLSSTAPAVRTPSSAAPADPSLGTLLPDTVLKLYETRDPGVGGSKPHCTWAEDTCTKLKTAKLLNKKNDKISLN